MVDLTQRSIEIILQNQAPSGAFMASPNFPNYRFCWFRDGSFIAYAMDLIGEHACAARFHEWAAMVVNRHAEIAQRAIERTEMGEPLRNSEYLHARYTVDGADATPNEWPNFQLDGYGTWLWSVAEHLASAGKPLPAAWKEAAGLIASYLTALWQHPCYDCWEENPDNVHSYTLAAIYGGLEAHGRLTGCDHHATQQAIAGFVLQDSESRGYFVKSIGSDMVDASLLGLATPYRLVEPHDPRMLTTVERIEQSLMQGDGVHRYATDSYYGGGEWVLLAGWLGWYFAEVGERDKAEAMLKWMQDQADAEGCLPEQVPLNLNDPHNYEPWMRYWGPIAKPLLWSHAMYLVLQHYVSS
jgi:GH15 family glucan-1,4-alpha-glucosidase